MTDKDPEGFLDLLKITLEVDKQLIEKSEKNAPAKCKKCIVFKRCHGPNWNMLKDVHSCEEIIKHYTE